MRALFVVGEASVTRAGTVGLDFIPAKDIAVIGAALTQTTNDVYAVLNDAHGIFSLSTQTPGYVTVWRSGRP